MINFPARIRYIDKDEVQVVNTSEEIQKRRAFVVEEISPKWGRRSIVNQYLEGEDYESA